MPYNDIRLLKGTLVKNKLNRVKETVKHRAPEIALVGCGISLFALGVYTKRSLTLPVSLPEFPEGIEAQLIVGPSFESLFESGKELLYGTTFGEVLVRPVPKI